MTSPPKVPIMLEGQGRCLHLRSSSLPAYHMLLSRLYLTSASLTAFRTARASQICLPTIPFQGLSPNRVSSTSFSSTCIGRMTGTIDKAETSNSYEPFLLSPMPGAEKDGEGVPIESEDWTADLELETVRSFAETSSKTGGRLRVLVLYGSLRERYRNLIQSPPWIVN